MSTCGTSPEVHRCSKVMCFRGQGNKHMLSSKQCDNDLSARANWHSYGDIACIHTPTRPGHLHTGATCVMEIKKVTAKTSWEIGCSQVILMPPQKKCVSSHVFLYIQSFGYCSSSRFSSDIHNHDSRQINFESIDKHLPVHH